MNARNKTGGGLGSNQYGPKGRPVRPKIASTASPAHSATPRIFASPREARTVIHTQARAVAKQGRFSEDEALQQFFVGRLVDRVFVLDTEEDWILKGGISALARGGMVRYSAEADMQSECDFEQATDSLVVASHHDLGDQVAYRYVSTRRYERHPGSGQVDFEALIGDQVETVVSVDVSTTARLTAEVEHVRPTNPLGIEGLAGPGDYRLYPTVDQIADKLAATYERISGPSGTEPSARHRDLVDLEIIARTRKMTGDALHVAVVTEFKARSLNLPASFDVPDRRTWGRSYELMVGSVPELRNQTIDDGLRVVRALVDPVLAGDRPGLWNPGTLQWRRGR